MFKKLTRPLASLFAIVTLLSLTACGGGGGVSLTQPAETHIQLVADTTSLPVQQSYYYPDQTSLYTTRVVATVQDSKGNPATAGTVQFSIVGGKTNTGALFETDFKTKVTVTNPDGTTTDHPAAFWGLPVGVSGGSAQVLFQAGTQTGTVTVKAIYTDPTTGGQSYSEVKIDVGSPLNTGMPSSFSVSLLNTPIYITGQGLNDQAGINVYLYDASGQPVTNPGTTNNIQAQIIGDNLGGAYLVGANGSGQTVASRTVGDKGLATFSVLSGTKSGTLHIRLTADAADNNIDNGIQKAVTKDISLPISDGRVASISFGGPFINAIKNNKTSVALNGTDFIDQGTYSRSISAVVQDANGNPVPGVTIRFGLIDSPLTAGSYPDPGFSPQQPISTTSSGPTFAIQGTKGNPVEGGNNFDEQDGVNLLTMGVRPLDRLVLWPSEQGTQRDMLGSRLIAGLVGTSALTTTANFAYPTTPGYVDGYNIPWIIGRAQYGNIGATATTDSNGVATTFITYPVSRLDQPAILTAEAPNGVSSNFYAYYVGVAGGTLTSSVTKVPANAQTAVTMCATDANKAPLPNFGIQAGLTHGATISSGSLTTGSNGCAYFVLDTTAVPAGTAQFDIQFSIGTDTNESTKITVEAAPQPATAANLLVSISGATDLVAPQRSRDITITAVDSTGNPVANQIVQLSFTATDDGNAPTATIDSAPAVTATTDSSGQATVTVTYSGNTGDTYSLNASSGSATATQVFPY